MVHVAKMVNLESLSMNNTAVSDDGISQIGQLSKLESLSIGKTAISDDSVEYLRRLKLLTSLYASDSYLILKAEPKLAAESAR